MEIYRSAAVKKIGIITITEGRNYGNRLQNYALQQTIKKMGFEVETINKIFRRERKLKLVTYKVKTVIRNVLHINKRTGICRREKNFAHFNKKYINMSKYWTYKNDYKKGISNQFDYFVCGSDQIWNPNFEECLADLESSTAHFAPKEKRIVYAASMGVSELGKEYTELYKKLLLEIKFISMREKAGATIVKKLLNRDVPVVLDPTLLLSKEEWIDFSNKPSTNLPVKYISTYFLGNQSEKTTKYINEISKKFKLPIVEINNEYLWDSEIKNIDYFSMDPTQFVYVISHCQILFTDSFHGSVFATIFEKPFRVFKRDGELGDMWSRMETLMDCIGDNMVIGKEDEELDGVIGKTIQYNKKNLEKKKEQSLDYLKKALGLEK